MRKEDNLAELVIAELLVKQFNANRLRYQAITLTHNGLHTLPDFDVLFDDHTIFVEVTQAPLLSNDDPKRKQRSIFEGVSLERPDISWIILYLQHCVTPEGLTIASSSLDLLVNRVDSLIVQNNLDVFAHKSSNIPNIHAVDWNVLRSKFFKNTHTHEIKFWR